MQLFYLMNAAVLSHDKIYALPKYINISIRSTHLFLFHCFSSSSFYPVSRDMTVVLHFLFALIDGSVHFFPQFFPCILPSNFVKTHWVLWAPYYLFFYEVWLNLWHFPQSTPFHNYQNAQQTAQHYRFAPLFKTEASGMKRRAEEQTEVMCHVARPHLLSQ